MKLSYILSKENFLILRETETPKNCFIFYKMEPSYISGNGTFQSQALKTYYISKWNFKVLSFKKFLIFFLFSFKKLIYHIFCFFLKTNSFLKILFLRI